MARKCGKCGVEGHYQSTCGKAKAPEVIPEPLPQTGFDKYVEEKKKDPEFAAEFEKATEELANPEAMARGFERLRQATNEATKAEAEAEKLDPRKGLWIVNPERKRIAGRIMYVKGTGEVVYETPFGGSVDSTPERLTSNGYCFVELEPKMLLWNHMGNASTESR